MPSISQIIYENSHKPLSIEEIMRFSGKSRHKVESIIYTLEKNCLLDVLNENAIKKFYLKKNAKKEDVENCINNASSKPTKLLKFVYKPEILILICIIIFLIISAELFFRLYYWHSGKHIAVDENERCLKEMKIDNLPTDFKNNNFANFTRTGYWKDDPIMGITLKENLTEAYFFPTGANQTQMMVFYGEHTHNSRGMTGLDEFQIKKPKNVKLRIALFGDSFTCGGEAPLFFGMANILKELIPNSEIQNFCVGGRGIEAMYTRYAIQAKKYKPDILIFNIYIDDLQRPFGCLTLVPNLTISNGRIIIGLRKYPTLKNFYYNYSLPKFESYFLKHIIYAYNQNTQYPKFMKQGRELFEAMLEDIKNQTKEQNSTLIVSLIQSPTPNNVEINEYSKLSSILKQKNIPYLDTTAYFASKRIHYRNQSFYYVQDKDALSHYSVIGYALHAQGLKNILQIKKIINYTPEYYFANSYYKTLLYLLPEELPLQMAGHIRTIAPFQIINVNYTTNNTVINSTNSISG